MRRLRTRPAVTDDYNFVYDVNRQAFRPYVEQVWGWDEEEQLALFLEEFDPTSTEVIIYRGQDIGFLRVEDHGDYLFIDTIAILPLYQRRGLGRTLIRRVLARAADLDVKVKLSVLQVNPARTLYERLGFRVTGGDEFRTYMEATPTAGDSLVEDGEK